MLQAYTLNAAGLAVAQDVAIPFNTNVVMTGCTATHVVSTDSVRLNRPGYYMVHFNAYGAPAAAGDLTVTMYNNGEEVPYASAAATSTGATDTVNLSFTTLVQVCPACACSDNTAYLTFRNEGGDATYNLANVVVTKLC